jgi:pimeloyl-ACP methyl ester carboxylesterase
MGGMIAQEIVFNYTERIEKLILCSTHCGGSKKILPSNEIVISLLKLKEHGTSEQIIQDFIPLIYTKEFIESNRVFIESFKKKVLKFPIQSDSFQRQFNACDHFRAGVRLKKVRTPTLIIQGKKDIFVPPENAEILNKMIYNSKLILLNNAAHLFYQPKPEEIVNNILEFLTT